MRGSGIEEEAEREETVGQEEWATTELEEGAGGVRIGSGIQDLVVSA